MSIKIIYFLELTTQTFLVVYKKLVKNIQKFHSSLKPCNMLTTIMHQFKKLGRDCQVQASV